MSEKNYEIFVIIVQCCKHTIATLTRMLFRTNTFSSSYAAIYLNNFKCTSQRTTKVTPYFMNSKM